MADEKLQIVISATDQASPALKAVAQSAKAIGEAAKAAGDATQGGFGRAAAAIQPYEAGIRTASIAMVGLGAATVAVAGKCVAAIMEQEEATTRLNAAIAATGTVADSAGLIKLAEDLQKVTRYSDESIESMQAFLINMGFSGDQVAKMTPRVLDLARATGKDLDTSARMLGMTIQKGTNTMSRMGIVIDDTTLKSGDLDAILAQVDSHVGGMAERMGGSAADSAAILKNQWGELQEAGGKALLPTIQLINKGLIPMVELMTKVADSPVGKALVFVGTAGGIAAGGLGMIGLAAPPVLRGLAAIEAALIKVGITSRATAAAVSTSAAQMAVATNAAGAAAGGGAAVGGAGAAIGGATAGFGLRSLIGRGAAAAGRFVGGRTAAGLAGPIGVGAAVALTGYELYAANKQARSEAQIAAIENAPYNAVQSANMARWKAGRAAIAPLSVYGDGEGGGVGLAGESPLSVYGEGEGGGVPPALWGGSGTPIGLARPKAPGTQSADLFGPARQLASGGQNFSVRKELLPGGGYKIIVEVDVNEGVGPGTFADGVTDWMTDLQYAQGGIG